MSRCRTLAWKLSDSAKAVISRFTSEVILSGPRPSGPARG